MGAERLGHGVRLIEDTHMVDGEITDMGRVATEVLESGVALEICPTSNLHTQRYAGAAAHPVGALHRAGFNVTVNTDNRLMSRTTPTAEFALVIREQGFDVRDLEAVTRQAAAAAFCDPPTRNAIQERVAAGYA